MAVCVCVLTSAAAKDAPKIGSTSLCGDAYLRALMPEQIAALSWQSRDPVSRANEAEKTLPQIWDEPELLLASGLDMIVFGPGEGARSADFISSSVRLNWGEEFAAVKSNFQQLGDRLNVNAGPIIRDIEMRLLRLKPPTLKPKILYLDRSGGSAGSGTFVDAVIKAAGGENLISQPSWSKPDAEFLLGLSPDLILTSYFDDGYESVNAQPLRHQALQDYIARHERLEIPGSLWPCAGPGLVEAAELLNEKIWALP